MFESTNQHSVVALCFVTLHLLGARQGHGSAKVCKISSSSTDKVPKISTVTNIDDSSCTNGVDFSIKLNHSRICYGVLRSQTLRPVTVAIYKL